MNQLEQEVGEWLGAEERVPSRQRVDELMTAYPYFTLPAAILAGAGVVADADDLGHLRRHVALNTPDHEALRALLDPDDKAFAGFYPEQSPEPAPTTSDTIDKFISTYGHNDPNEEAVLMRMIFNPTPDYAQVLAAEEERSVPSADEAPAGSHDRMINDFILKTKAASSQSDEPADAAAAADDAADMSRLTVQTVEESSLTESLAKMYIGQHRYEKAYEIINNLNLNFPEKSIYFADQLRFLRKLILAQTYAKASQTDNK